MAQRSALKMTYHLCYRISKKIIRTKKLAKKIEARETSSPGTFSNCLGVSRTRQFMENPATTDRLHGDPILELGTLCVRRLLNGGNPFRVGNLPHRFERADLPGLPGHQSPRVATASLQLVSKPLFRIESLRRNFEDIGSIYFYYPTFSTK